MRYFIDSNCFFFSYTSKASIVSGDMLYRVRLDNYNTQQWAPKTHRNKKAKTA